ncbi:MAG: AAA family ATPase [Candidatus Promineifilaceae bacterium]
MQILSLEYEDKLRRWKLEQMDFRLLTLIVGASGVGKTQVLQAVGYLKLIASGASFSGVKWNVKFQTLSGVIFRWYGEFSTDADIKNGNVNASRIIEEGLHSNGQRVIERENGVILFNNEQTITLPHERSVLDMLRENPVVSDAYTALGQIRFTQSNNWKMPSGLLFGPGPAFNLDQYNSLEEVQSSNESLLAKLYLLNRTEPDLFSQWRSQCKSVFPFIEDIRVKADRYQEGEGVDVTVEIKEYGVDQWISEYHLSSGMHRTLLQIAELYLIPSGSLILIDEFENSLGVNCIDEVMDLILGSQKLQFIITSHHPYIINGISSANWKMLTRSGGVVKAHDVEDLGFGKSKHQAFMQLINLDEFSEGVNV